MQTIADLIPSGNVFDPSSYNWSDLFVEQRHVIRQPTRITPIARRASRAPGRQPIRARRSRKSSSSSSSTKSSSSDPPGPPPRPAWLTPLFDNIPARLKARRQWVVWRAVWNGRKWTKPPFRTDGWKASHSNPDCWTSFEEVCRIFGKGDWDGIGYVLTPDDDLTGIDLDHCYNPESGHIAAWALKIIQRFASYCEVSPSGTGIRIFVLGRLPGTGHKIGKLGRDGTGALEIYNRNRYLTLTGHRLKGSPSTIKSSQRAINALLKEHWPNVERPVAAQQPL